MSIEQCITAAAAMSWTDDEGVEFGVWAVSVHGTVTDRILHLVGDRVKDNTALQNNQKSLHS